MPGGGVGGVRHAAGEREPGAGQQWVVATAIVAPFR